MKDRIGVSAHVEGLVGGDNSAILEETGVERTGADAQGFVTWRQMFTDVHFSVQ